MNKRYQIKQKAGFTLIEVIIAVAIIGILMVVVLASLSTARARGRDAKRAGDIKQVQQALENYFENHNAYPATVSDNAIPPELSVYLSSIPRDPAPQAGESNGQVKKGQVVKDYFYSCTLLQPNCLNYCLAVQFEAGVPSSLGPSSGCVQGYNYSVQAMSDSSSQDEEGGDILPGEPIYPPGGGPSSY